MCINCWKEYGSPAIGSEKIRSCANAIEELYKTHPTGGAFHIVLDDYNISQGFVAWCWNFLHEDGNELGFDSHDYDLHKVVFKLMLDMTDEEIASAIALTDGFWQP